MECKRQPYFQSGTIFGEWLIYHVSFLQYIQTRQKRIHFYNICVAYCLIERMEIFKQKIFLVCPVTDLAKKGKGLGWSSITPPPRIMESLERLNYQALRTKCVTCKVKWRKIMILIHRFPFSCTTGF